MSAPEIVYDLREGPGDVAARVQCPECDLVGAIDYEQFAGAVSIDCPNEDCSYHETHDLRTSDV